MSFKLSKPLGIWCTPGCSHLSAAAQGADSGCRKLGEQDRAREWPCHQKTQAAQALQCQQQHGYPGVCLGHGIAREKREVVPAELSW